MRELDNKVNSKRRGLFKSDKILWDEFQAAFIIAFTDITMTQEAYNKLKSLEIVGDDLNMYIATHDSLVLWAEWTQDGNAAIKSFCNELKRQLHLSVLKKDKVPITLQM